jgi:hypothetical protein
LSNVLGVTFALALYLPLVSFIDQTRNSQTANFTYQGQEQQQAQAALQ